MNDNSNDDDESESDEQNVVLNQDVDNNVHKNLDTIGKQNYQEPGVEVELNFEFFEFTIVLNNDMGTKALHLRP